VRNKFACIRDGHVIEIQYLTETELKDMETLFDQVVRIKDTDGEVDVGYAYDGDRFYMPSRGSH